MEDRHRRPTTIGTEKVVHDDEGRIIGFVGETPGEEGEDRFFVRSVLKASEVQWFPTAEEALAFLKKT